MIGSRIPSCVFTLATVLMATEATNMVKPCKPVQDRGVPSGFVAEAVVASENIILPNGAVPVGADVKAMIAARKLEMRLRVEYDQGSGNTTVTTWLASPGEAMPASERPAPRGGNVLQTLELSADTVRGGIDEGSTFAVLGSLRGESVAWLGTTLAADTPVSIHIRFDSKSLNIVDDVTVAWPGGAITAIAGVTVVNCLPARQMESRLMQSSAPETSIVCTADLWTVARVACRESGFPTFTQDR